MTCAACWRPPCSWSSRLLAHPDPKVVKAGETVVKAVRRAEARLLETRSSDIPGAPRPGHAAAIIGREIVPRHGVLNQVRLFVFFLMASIVAGAASLAMCVR